MKVAFAIPPKFLRKPGKKRNGPCRPSSMPSNLAAPALICVVMSQIGAERLVGSRNAGDDASRTETGRPVLSKVWPETVCESGKFFTSFLNTATDAIDSGAKYHSIPA